MRLAVDIGGTFTDLVLELDDRTLASAKELTEYQDTATAMVHAAERLLSAHGARIADVAEIVHGTTLASNVVLQRNGPVTAMVTTRGFRDILVIQRQRRHHLYDVNVGKPEPLVPRRLVFEVSQRTSASGATLVELDEQAVREDLVPRLRDERVEAVAICLLNSFADPTHEQRVAAILAEELPGLEVSVSSEISLRYREYERASTAVMNAYVTPVVRTYLGRLSAVLDRRGFSGRLYLMQSNGGVATLPMVQDAPIRLIESGPAAGALIAARYGQEHGARHVVALEMGGTTAKVSLSDDGQLGMVDEFEVDRKSLRAGSGLPIDVRAVDLVEIGAGGGSIASVRMGVVAVGPRSAGSTPGPACYARGGGEPTVTDANLVLGYLDPEDFASGQVQLDVERARAAIEQHVAEPLGLSVEQAAWGIHEVATAQMAAAIKVSAIERGRDPRVCSLIAFGGAGPAHAIRIARDLGIGRVILPPLAGVASAVGLLISPIRLEFARTSILRLDGEAAPEIGEIYRALEQEARGRLEAGSYDRGAALDVVFERSADVRYVGQGYQVAVDVPAGPVGDDTLGEMRNRFASAYRTLYGYSDGVDAPIEAVDWRVAARVRGGGADPVAASSPTAAGPGASRASGSRSCYFPETEGYVECDVYARSSLEPGEPIAGPAVIHDPDTTTVVLPDTTVVVDDGGHLVAEVRARSVLEGVP